MIRVDAVVAVLVGWWRARRRARDHARRRADLVLEHARVFTATRHILDRCASRFAAATSLRSAPTHGTSRRRVESICRRPARDSRHSRSPMSTSPSLFDRVRARGHRGRRCRDDAGAASRSATHEVTGGNVVARRARLRSIDAACTREALDRVAPMHPLWIDNSTGHVVVLNSRRRATARSAERRHRARGLAAEYERVSRDA